LHVRFLDLAVVAAYLAGTLLVGVLVGRRQRGVADYMVGGRDIPWWALLFSIVATETSTVTFLSIPGFAYARDLISGGVIGEPIYWRGVCDEDYMADADTPFSWRCRRDTAGFGALGDLAATLTSLYADTNVLLEACRDEALDQARRGRLHILEKMYEALSAPRKSISNFAPRIVTIRIPVDKIRDVIGPGGKMIRSIIERTGVKIDVEDDGRVNVASADETSAQKAISIIQELTATPELNKTYLGKVQRITDFGAFVEIMPGTDGLLHVSEIANHRVKDVRDELKEGEQVLVKVINIDPTGKIRLSRKALLQEQGAAPAFALRQVGQ